jgi:hypothetical protein
MTRTTRLTLALPLLATPLLAQGTAAVKQTALARVTLAEQVASDPALRRAVAAKNATRESQETIAARDREWSSNPAAPLRKALTGSDCARRLRELIAPDPLVVEAILMDERGANVCVSRETSDYFQGDEEKWKKTFVEGRSAFVDEPAFDQSSGTYAVQLSVPVAEGGKRVGALCLTLKVKKDAMGAAK